MWNLAYDLVATILYIEGNSIMQYWRVIPVIHQG